MASCLYGTHVPVQLTDSTPTTRSSKSVNVGERGTTVNWRLTFTAPPSALCHQVVGMHYCCRAAAGAYTHAALRRINRQSREVVKEYCCRLLERPVPQEGRAAKKKGAKRGSAEARAAANTTRTVTLSNAGPRQHSSRQVPSYVDCCHDA